MLEHRVRLTNAKIATLGERVEDVFFITDEHGNALQDADACLTLQQDMRNTLDNIQ
jgi:[protein-PII] uridylyltransferase